jgi:hypothetical protein
MTTRMSGIFSNLQTEILVKLCNLQGNRSDLSAQANVSSEKGKGFREKLI